MNDRGFFSDAKYVSGITHQYTPLNNNPDTSFQTLGYGEVHLQGRRGSQEDSGLFVKLETPLLLTPQQVAERLWSSIKMADELLKTEREGDDQGTTACVACLHQKHLITANVADTVLFALLYNSDGELLSVTRLTENLHSPDDPNELNRIKSQGGIVVDGGVNDGLRIARAIGDHKYNSEGKVIISDAALGIYPLKELLTALNPHNETVGELKFVMTCDGFTEAADELRMKHHEYLKTSFDIIKNRTYSIDFNESYMSLALARKAIEDGSRDNVSVATFTYNPYIANTSYFAIFDGHGGQKAVNLVVTNFADIFNKQIALPEEDYQQQPLSTQNNKADFQLDNESMIKVLSPDNVAIEDQKLNRLSL